MANANSLTTRQQLRAVGVVEFSSICSKAASGPSFTISHRPSTIKKADVIYILKDGRIIEIGTNDELIARKVTLQNG